jgi:hypothetical protein
MSNSLFIRLIDISEEEANLSRFIFVRFFHERRRVFDELRQLPHQAELEVTQTCQEFHWILVLVG